MHPPTLPTLIVQQVGSYLGYTGHVAAAVARASLNHTAKAGADINH
jgi:hypothetical protein